MYTQVFQCSSSCACAVVLWPSSTVACNPNQMCVVPSQRGLQMLRKGAKNSDNHRVRADFLESKANLEANVTGERELQHNDAVIKLLLLI